MLRVLISLAMVVTALVGNPGAPAHATTDYLYWTNQGTGAGLGTIERSALDGSGRETFLSGRNSPSALTSDGTYLYWTEWRGNGDPETGIFRALLTDPTSVTKVATTFSLSYGIAVTATHLYWSESWLVGGGGTTNVVRAGLDGTGPTNFVTGLTTPYGMTVNATHLFIAEFSGDGTGANGDRVLRVPLNAGTPVERLISPGGTAGVDDVAVTSTHLYWSQSNSGKIGRSLLDGTSPNEELIGPATASSVSGLTGFGSKLYWTRYLTSVAGGIWSADLDGTGSTQLVSSPRTVDVIVVSFAQTSSTDASTPALADFSFFLPDGRECSAISPMRVRVGTSIELPGADANCRTMPGSTVVGWTVPVPPGFSGAGSRAMPFGPGEQVRVIGSQRFTAVLLEPIVTIVYDANVDVADVCAASSMEHTSVDGRQGFSWVPREVFAVARIWVQAPCAPPGYRLMAWNTSGNGTGQRVDLGARLPETWKGSTDNERRLYAVWQRM